MKLDIRSMEDTLAGAVDAYFLDREGKPELIETGFDEVDEELGGLGPRSSGILAAATGVGKSSALLAAALDSTTKTGIISFEDGPDVVGARVLARLTGINSRYIRRKFLLPTQLAKLNAAAASGEASHVFFAYPPNTIAALEASVEALAARGCKMIWLDYLQKVRGHGGGDRRNEVGATFTSFDQACKKADIAGMAVSQFRRLSDTEKEPSIHHLKESGDLENEARLIILVHKLVSDDPACGTRVRFRVAKSVFGGEDISFDYLRGACGSLYPAEFLSTPEPELPGAEINF